MSTVELQNVTKIFDKTVKALDDISFTVKDAEFFVLLGPTGAGKTTTLRAIAGLEKVDQGKILFDQEDVTTAQPAARDTAFVFQQYSLYPHYKVFDNLAFPLRSPLRKVPEEEINSKVNKIAEMLKISNKLNNKATELSGGEMQRVAIGRALVRDPNIYLMDEPLSSLDAKLRESLRVELKKIQLDLHEQFINLVKNFRKIFPNEFKAPEIKIVSVKDEKNFLKNVISSQNLQTEEAELIFRAINETEIDKVTAGQKIKVIY